MHKFILSVAFSLGITTLAFGQTINRIDGTKISIDSLNQKIEGLRKKANIPGIAIAIYNNNQPVLAKTYGFANAEDNTPLKPTSILYAASFAKMVLAYITMQLVDEKVIELDTPLVKYLSLPLTEYKIKGRNRGYHDLEGDNRYKKITARMCLTHTTGFPNWRWFEADNKLKFKYDPGTRYNYSGEGIYLLQFTIEQLTGKDYETISQERVFKPLGMMSTSHLWLPSFDTNVCFGHDEKGVALELMKWKNPNAGGSMSTTLEDFMKFYLALINGVGLSQKNFDNMMSPQVRIKSKRQFGPMSNQDGTENDSIQLSYGLGVGIFNTPYGRAVFKEGHDDGWGHYSIWYSEKKIAVVMMTNSDNGESIFKELLAYSIGDIYTPWQWENYIPYSEKK